MPGIETGLNQDGDLGARVRYGSEYRLSSTYNECHGLRMFPLYYGMKVVHIWKKLEFGFLFLTLKIG